MGPSVTQDHKMISCCMACIQARAFLPNHEVGYTRRERQGKKPHKVLGVP